MLVISSATISNVIQCLITRPQSALSHTKKVSNIVAGSSGYVMFSGLSPGVYTLRVVATNRKPDKVFITIRFEITDDPDRCTLHLINEGVSVREDSVRVEFTGRGPASDYLCSLDKTQPYKCMCLTVLTVALRFGVIWTLSLSYITKHGITWYIGMAHVPRHISIYLSLSLTLSPLYLSPLSISLLSLSSVCVS